MNVSPSLFLKLTAILVIFFGLVQYLTEGFARIFSPTDDHYPETGVQPYDSEPYAAPKS
ncbi:hypothetical protein [Chroococcus sp. FPU101]|uniref:hypothetical protein n=1 Tax=Chroococcus sp. FPU101 TaxID=1974212 RepID=UPI001F5DCDB0|nr:hypothetical protein [Chroococcus sp. FPU101]